MFCPVNYLQNNSVTNEFNTTVDPLQYRTIDTTGEVLGQGNFGSVSVTPEGVVKSYLKPGLEGLVDLAREISAARDLELPLNTTDHKSYIALASAVDLQNFRTLMPRARTDLYHIIREHEKSKRFFPDDQLVQIAYDLCMGLYNIHYNNVAHLDIKPENVLLFPSESSSSSSSSESFTYKYTDFGLSATQVCSGWIKSIRGTPAHMAPEILISKTLGKPSDIWALGVLFLHITYPSDTTLWFHQWGTPAVSMAKYVDLMLATTSPPISRETLAAREKLLSYTFENYMRDIRSGVEPLIPVSDGDRKRLLTDTPLQLARYKIDHFDAILASKIHMFPWDHLYPSDSTPWRGLPSDLDTKVLGPIIRLMLNVDYKKRPSIDAIINNPLFARFRGGRILPAINCYNNVTMARQAYYPQGVQNIIDPMVRRTIMLVIYKAYPQQLGEASFIFDQYISMRPEVTRNATELIKVVLAAVYIANDIIHHNITLNDHGDRKLLQHQVLHKNLVDIDRASESLKSYTIPLDSSSPDTTMQRLSRTLMMIPGFDRVMMETVNDVLTTLDFRLRPTLPEDYGSVSMTALNLMRVHGLPLTHPLNDIYRAASAVKFELAKTPAPCALTPGAVEVLKETLRRETEVKTPSSSVGAIMPTIRSIVARFGGV